MNEYQIRILGGIAIPEALDTAKSVMVSVEADIYEAAKRDLQAEGKHLIIYKAKAVGFPLVSQGEKKYKAVIKSKKSQALRWAIQEYGEDYDEFMQKMLDNIDDVINFVRKLT